MVYKAEFRPLPYFWAPGMDGGGTHNTAETMVPSPATRNLGNGENRADRLIEEEVAQGGEEVVIDHEFAFPLCFPLSSGEGLLPLCRFSADKSSSSISSKRRHLTRRRCAASRVEARIIAAR